MPRVSNRLSRRRPPQSLWDRILAEPDRAPEHLALAASERFADPAAQWADGDRAVRRRGLAKIARRKYARRARWTGAGLGVGGITTSALDLATLGWIQGRMVFLIVAAAYGYDPHDPMRPAELLYLLGASTHPRRRPGGPRRRGQAPGARRLPTGRSDRATGSGRGT